MKSVSNLVFSLLYFSPSLTSAWKKASTIKITDIFGRKPNPQPSDCNNKYSDFAYFYLEQRYIDTFVCIPYQWMANCFGKAKKISLRTVYQNNIILCNGV